jgi:hypothetical protein
MTGASTVDLMPIYQSAHTSIDATHHTPPCRPAALLLPKVEVFPAPVLALAPIEMAYKQV